MTWPDRPRVLLSYAYAAKYDLAAYPDAEVVIDSGAFTAHTSGKAVDHHAYLRWLAQHAGRVRFAFSLDVIGDPVASMKNYLTAVDAVGDRVRIVPTWHIGTDFAVLDELTRATDYVAIGGAVPYASRQKVLMRQFVAAHRIARDNGARLHGLGVSGSGAVRRLPWASVDSSSWTIPQRRPVAYLATRGGVMRSLTYGQPVSKADAGLARVYGLDPAAMSRYGYSSAKHVGTDTARARQVAGAVAACRSYMHVESVVTTHVPHFRLYLAAQPRDRVPFTAHAAGSPFAGSS